MDKNRTKKKKKIHKRIIGASLLAVILIFNFINSAFQSVEAKGRFVSVKQKAEDAISGSKPIKILEILPASDSVSMMSTLISGQEPFLDYIESIENSDLSEEEKNGKIKELAELFGKYGIINMDSTASSIYPLTYYKPGDEESVYSNAPVLPEEQKGYTLVEKKLVDGYFKEITKAELENSEIAYYREILVTATPTPTMELTVSPTEGATGTPTVTPEVTEEATLTVTAAPTNEASATPTPTTAGEVSTTPTETPTPEPTVTQEPTATAEPTQAEVTDTPVAGDETARIEAREGRVVASELVQEEKETQVEAEVINEEDADVTPTQEAMTTVTAEATPTESADVTVTQEPDTSATPTPTAEATATPTPISESKGISEVYLMEDGKTVYLEYCEEGFQPNTDGGRYFRFIATEPEMTVSADSYPGKGYRFIFGSRAEIRNNDLFKRFVLGIENETQLAVAKVELTTASIETISAESLSNYDLIYIAQPVLYRDAVTGEFMEYDYANPSLSEEEKKMVFSPWVTVASAMTGEDSESAAVVEALAKKLLTGVVDETTPLKIVADTSVLEEYERAVRFYENTASVLDGTTAGTLTASYGETIKKNAMYKAFLFLAQKDIITSITGICDSTTITNGGTTYTINEDKWAEETLSETLRDAIYNEDKTELDLINGGHYVNRNVYFYKHMEKNYESVLCDDNALEVVNGDFRSIIKKSILEIGFKDVVDAIDAENERYGYLEDGSAEKIDGNSISADMIFQYLLNYTGKAIEIKKNTISVLEIEPCADFSYSDDKEDAQKEFVNKWISYFGEQSRYEDVTFTCMSMQEFIGKNEDLNATYDLIYIGANIGKFQTVNSDGITRRFNDTSMNGLIYTHIGDTTGKEVTVMNGLGLLDTDYSGDDRSTGSFNSSRTTTMRTTGNDLTTYKKRDLLNFLNSGYPVIVADTLFKMGSDEITGNTVPTGINADESGSGGSVPSTSDTRTVYIRKPTTWTSWDTIYVHMWNSDGDKTDYPGTKATYLRKEGNYYWYQVSMPKTYDHFQVNNNSAKFENKSLGNKDVYTVTLGNNLTISNITAGTNVSSGVNGTVDTSTYMYQLLKIATADVGTANLEEINKNRTLKNYESPIEGLTFNWEDRVFPNLVNEGMSNEVARVTMPQYLNETKVYLNLTDQPTTYGYELDSGSVGNPIDEDSVAYLEKVDGRYYLNYTFSISSLAGTLSTSEYDCKLFVDANFDGKFSENSEELDSLVIKDSSGTIQTKMEGEDTYRLKENTVYMLSRKLPKDFDGCINWKLQVNQVDNKDILAAETGYCAIPVTPKKQDGSADTSNNKQEIKILQITSGDSTAEYSDRRTTYTGTHVNLEKQLSDSYSIETWHNLLKQIPDFDLKITTKSANEVAAECVAWDKANSADNGGYLINQGYDMVIVGFIDVFGEVGYEEGSFNRKASSFAESILRFGNSGKSILFTHDTTAWHGDYQKITKKGDVGDEYLDDIKNSSSYLTIAIRDLCGNDQFGIVTPRKSSDTEESTVSTADPMEYINQFFENYASTGKEYDSDSTEWSELIGSGKDLAFKPNSNQSSVLAETQGSTYTNLRNFNYDFSGKNAETYVQYVKDLIPGGSGSSGMYDSDKQTVEEFEVGKVNDGAITEYPYQLKDTFNVKSTHSQYWTVDIESDSNGDEESDLVVWYCLNKRSKQGVEGPTIDFYKGSPNDVRNNYYIYNKGNITYSGAGHSPFSGEDEIKLFINTMIAAYNAQVKVPEVSIVENGELEAEELENIIIPYDKAIASSDVDFVNFGTGTDGSDGTVKIYFNVYDGNLVAREKTIKLDEIFITDKNGSDINGTETGKRYTDSTQLPIYDALDNSPVTYDQLKSSHTYYINAPMSSVFKDNQTIKLYVRIHTEIGEGRDKISTDYATDYINVSLAEIFNLD